MANLINLSHTDIPKLIEASDSEEVSTYENHTIDEVEGSDNDFDTGHQQMKYEESIQSQKSRNKMEAKSSATFFSISMSANIIKTIPGIKRYAAARTDNLIGTSAHASQRPMVMYTEIGTVGLGPHGLLRN
ncbi:hypothetical protein TNCV_2923621 [Trichonephila clavipes]|nr:hypothetical protein TNCV_2923621 [Trichonephila clavipes]